MAYKIAVASSDGKVVNQHFGRSKQFLIFEVNDSGKFSFIELRQGIAPCQFGEHDENDMQKAIEVIADCNAVLVSQIGPRAENALYAKKIKAFTFASFIDSALEKLISYEQRNKGILMKGF